ncbi:Odorant receptor, partial [Operophtera brumata]
VFFAANSILICGQLELLCCSLRNLRYTALLQHGVLHSAVAAAHSDIQMDEMHAYIYNQAEMTDQEYDEATMAALRACAVVSQAVMEYKDRFQRFVSPLLVLRVVQVTLYLCTLLYAATLNFDMMTVEYLAAVALDIFVYCYYGNQIIAQAERVTTAAYQSAWHTLGVRPRRALLNLLLANRRPMVVRAGRFLPMDLHTFVTAERVTTAAYQSAWHTLGVRPRRALLNLLLANRRPMVVRAGRFLPMDLHTFV